MTQDPIVEFQAVSKHFSGMVANDQIELQVHRAEIHAIVGENGAGKSTLMSLLAGLLQPDAGKILVRGEPVLFSSPRDAMRSGIGMVHQHFMLFDNLTALHNLMLQNISAFSWLNEKPVREKTKEICREAGFLLDWDELAGKLSVGDRQKLEIVKLLFQGGEILIFDEPTAVLTPLEINKLMVLLQKLRSQGKTILYVSHKLNEVLAIADRITVLRRGRVIDTVAAAKVSREDLVVMMMGKEVDKTEKIRGSRKETVALELRKVSAKDPENRRSISDVSFQIFQGEIYGIAGIAGNGQKQLANLVCGALQIEQGEIRFLETDITGDDQATRRRKGVALIPEDRDREGMVGTLSVWENLLLGRAWWPRYSWGGFLRETACRLYARQKIADYRIRLHSDQQPAGLLSGGNRQKLILARELDAQPVLLVAMEPVRGLDVAAEKMVSEQLQGARNKGAAVLLISSDLEELLALADRIGILFNGRLVREFVPGQLTMDAIGHYMLSGCWEEEHGAQ